MKKADSDEIILKGSCQVCKQPIEMFVSKEMISEGMQGLACDNGGIKVYGEQPVFLCQSCLEKGEKVGQPCEVYSRVVGYLRPVKQWNPGKKEEFEQRKEFVVK